MTPGSKRVRVQFQVIISSVIRDTETNKQKTETNKQKTETNK